MKLMKSPWLIVGITAYVPALAYLLSRGVYPPGEAAAILVIVGVGFSALAWLTTRWTRRRGQELVVTRREIQFVASYVLFITLYLTWGSELADSLVPFDPELGGATALFWSLGKKLLVFVLIPFWILRRWFGANLSSFGLPLKGSLSGQGGMIASAILMSLAILAFQLFLGQGAAPLRQGQFDVAVVLAGLPLAFLWLFIEVGLVEEFFFRGLLQARLAAFFGSEVAGLVLMALIFGLAHAPGLYLRGASGLTPLGSDPGLLATLAYCIVVLSLSGVFLGILWIRTRNLWVLMPVHATGDLLQSFPEIAEAFGVG